MTDLKERIAALEEEHDAAAERRFRAWLVSMREELVRIGFLIALALALVGLVSLIDRLAPEDNALLVGGLAVWALFAKAAFLVERRRRATAWKRARKG